MVLPFSGDGIWAWVVQKTQKPLVFALEQVLSPVTGYAKQASTQHVRSKQETDDRYAHARRTTGR